MTTHKSRELSLAEISHRFTLGELDGLAIADAALQRAEAKTSLNAFVELEAADVRASAEAAIERRKNVPFSSRVAGAPIAIADDIASTIGRTRAGSKMLGDYQAPFDAAVIENLREAGAILFGKTNVDEMGLGMTTESSIAGPTLHPHLQGRLAGGSSGGAAAAVAAGIVPAALAVDTVGSLRQPAAYCGVVGLRPTYGAVSRRGVFALGSSFDAVGVIAREVRDVAWVYSVISGHDPQDGTSTPLPAEDTIMEIEQGVEGLRVGLVREWTTLDPVSQAAVQRARESLEAAGATVVEVSLPLAEHHVATAFTLVSAEASSNFSRYDGVRFGYRSEKAANIDDLYSFSRGEGFGERVQQTILLGTHLLSEGCYRSHYCHAQRVRRLIVDEYQQAFTQCDVILSPSTVGQAPAPRGAEVDLVQEAQANRFSAGASLASLPAITLPVGVAADGAPVGVELCSRPHSEALLLRCAHRLEEALATKSEEVLG